MIDYRLDLSAKINNSVAFGNRTLFVCRFAVDDEIKNRRVDIFLNELAALSNYRLIDPSDSNAELHNKDAVVLFLVTSLANFDFLSRCSYSELTPKIVTYFLTAEEFKQINNTSFRRPFKAHLFYLVYPDELADDDLIYASHLKNFDTICVRTIRNKFSETAIGKSIAAYTKSNPQTAVAEMREMGWYLQDKGLNNSDSFAGALAIRFNKGILINASKTNKYHIETSRICYVDNTVSVTNEIKFVGYFPPSSETIVSQLIFQEYPSVNLMLHFHYKPMTYSPKLSSYRTSQYVPYGTLEEAEIIANKLRKTGDFVIAYGHGEFVFTSNFTEAKAVIDKIQNCLESDSRVCERCH